MNDKYTNGDAIDIIENEGLAHAILNVVPWDYFKDAETALLWHRSQQALDALQDHLEKETGRDIVVGI